MGIKEIIANAITGEQKQYLEDIRVANIFPDNSDELKPDGIKKMRTMVNDPTYIRLALPAWLSDSHKVIKNQFVSFRKKFQVSSKLAEKNLLVAQKAEEADKKMIEELSALELNMSRLEAKFGAAKKEAEKLSAEFFARKDSLKSEEAIKLEEFKAEFRKKRLEKAAMINSKLEEVKRYIAAEETKRKKTAEAILIAYAGKDEKKKKELLEGKYNWGPFTRSDKAKEAKQAYLLYHNQLDEWKQETFKDELRFLKEPEEFSSGMFKEFHKKLVDIDGQLKKMQDEMNALQKAINEADVQRQKVGEKIRELEKYKGEVWKYMEIKSKYNSLLLKIIKALGEEKSAFESVKSNSDKILNHIKKFLEGYKPESALADKITAAKTKGEINANDSTGGTIPLILIVAKCYYFFNKLAKSCEGKITAQEISIKELQKKLSHNQLISKYKKGKVISV